MASRRQKLVGSRFQAELRNIIADEFDGNMTEYSRQSNVPTGTLGHYLVSNRYPRVDIFDRMLKVLMKEPKARLLEAYLLDMTPPSARGQVVVRGAQESALEAKHLNGDLGIDDRLLGTLESLGTLAMENKRVRTILEEMAAVLKLSD
jgi:hypothetical protein